MSTLQFSKFFKSPHYIFPYNHLRQRGRREKGERKERERREKGERKERERREKGERKERERREKESAVLSYLGRLSLTTEQVLEGHLARELGRGLLDTKPNYEAGQRPL